MMEKRRPIAQGYSTEQAELLADLVVARDSIGKLSRALIPEDSLSDPFSTG